jgi:trigger factor
LADIKKIKLKDEEVRMAVFQEAMLHPSQSDEIIKYYVNNNQALRNLVAPLLEDKVIDFILSESTVKDRTIDFPTLKQTVQGVIPTPYDEEFEDSQEDQKTSKATPSTGSKPKAEKAKTRETKGKEA